MTPRREVYMRAGSTKGKSAGTCADCGAPATSDLEVVRDPERAARIVADCRGYLTAADFKFVPLCDACFAKRDES